MGRLVVFIGFDPESQKNIKKLDLLIERLKAFYEISLIHVPDDTLSELPHVRIEPLGNPKEFPPRDLIISNDELSHG